jgi:hypothetical protein
MLNTPEMLITNVIPLADALARWHEFYALLGTASATLVGLLFVAATIGSGIFSPDRRAASRVFLSASVVHFSGLLAVCLIVLVPLRSWVCFGTLIITCGIFGVGYYALTWHETIRDGLSKRIDLEDRIWYLVLPVVGYLFEAGSGVALFKGMALGCTTLALSAGMLLVVGIHNAWDITLWAITRRRE